MEHQADIEVIKEYIVAWEAMIAKVDALLEKGETVDFEAESQQIVTIEEN